jgi:glucose/arabinose dehydrogenase
VTGEHESAESTWPAQWIGRSGRACLVLVLLVAATLLGLPGRAAAASLPAGFAVRDLPSGQDEALTDFAFAPDGSWFTVGKNGRVAWVSADGRAHTLAQLSVATVQDLGLTGLAVPLDYESSRRIYTARTLSVDGRWTMRLSSWSVTGASEPTGLSDERVLWDLVTYADVHTMTGLVPDPDGSLWVTIGDAADFRFVDDRALGALDIDDGRGKVLHVLPDGRGVSSNPWYDRPRPRPGAAVSTPAGSAAPSG